MGRNIDIVIKQFKELATDNRNEQHYWENRPHPNAGTLEYAQNACKHAEENEQIVALLTELQERREADKWISVKDKLPEEETDVLVCNGKGDMIVCRGSRSTEIKDEFIWYVCDWRYGEITHWRPLPHKPYESEDK